MAAGTSARAYARMIKCGARDTSESDITCMAAVARHRRGNVVRRFAERVHAGIGAAVASGALLRRHALRGGVSKFRRLKCPACGMTSVAGQGSGNMVRRFSQRIPFDE